MRIENPTDKQIKYLTRKFLCVGLAYSMDTSYEYMWRTGFDIYRRNWKGPTKDEKKVARKFLMEHGRGESGPKILKVIVDGVNREIILNALGTGK